MQKDFSKYLGLKYTDEFNCSAFVELIYKNELGFNAIFPKKSDDEDSLVGSQKIIYHISEYFEKENDPKNLDAVVMKYAGANHYHIGIYVDGWKPKILHCDSRTGYSSFLDFQKIKNGCDTISIIGFYKLKKEFINAKN